MHPQSTQVTLSCAHCGASFLRYAKDRMAKDFCSLACWKTAIRSAAIQPVCAVCGNPFSKLNPSSRAKTCGSSCSLILRKRNRAAQMVRDHSERITVPCVQCGAPLSRVPSRVNANAQFCDHTCSRLWRARLRVDVTCTICGEVVIRKPSKVRSSRAICTKASCRRAFSSMTVTKHWGVSDEARLTICAWCGKELIRKPSEIAKVKANYCDAGCHAAADRGAGSLLWRGGSTPHRGPNWGEQRAKARRRDGNTCQHCGFVWKPGTRRLHVHHIIPFRVFGIESYEEANDLSNLVTLCPSCHKLLDWQQEMTYRLNAASVARDSTPSV